MSKLIKNYADLAKNDAYELMYEEYLPDIQSSGIILRHKKSGARVAVMSNADENKLFCAGFRTPPSNSTGVPHIIEHSVLNGSKNFPSRDPFMQLIKGSLNTFLNAMTYPDKTVYPVASCNDKDFSNLMNVYMDAVFYPNIYNYREIFMQEGWHYELENENDELKLNGVVYSEMKGAMSSADDVMWDTLGAVLFPDTTYGVNSGGDPDVIPELTYEEFIRFHKEHYNPANSYIFIYGNCDMDERLRFLDEKYLSDMDKLEADTTIAHQKHFGSREPKRVTKHYSVGQTDEIENKSILMFASMGGDNTDVLETKAAEIAAYVLFCADGAPVKQALLDAGIGDSIAGEYNTGTLEDSFCIFAKNTKSENADKFYSIIMDTLRAEVEKGIDEKALLATINSREFRFREADYSGYPRALDITIGMLGSWLYDDSKAFAYTHYLDTYAELKKKIGTGYYENIIRKYILESDHCALITLEPERGLIDKKNEELKNKLAAKKASLTKDELEKIIDDTAKLREYQSHVPTPEEQNCIPSIGREDIPVDTVPYFNEEREVGGVKTVYHDVDTNGITYANIFFNVSKLPHKYVPYLTLLSGILKRVDTAEYSYSDLGFDIMLNLGSLDFGMYRYQRYGEFDNYGGMYGVYLKMLADKVDYGFKLASEIALTSKLDDKKRLRDIISDIRTGMRANIIRNGHSVAIRRANSYFSKAACYSQQLDGLDYYFFIADLADNFDERADEIIENLTKVRNCIFTSKDVIMSLASDEAGYKNTESAVREFIDSFCGLKTPELGAFEEYVPVKKNEGILVPSQVQYLAMCGNMYADGIKYNGALQVVSNSVDTDYLYQQIRVKGGAYGESCGFVPDNGNMYFWSYRDPKLAETKEAYSGAGRFVREHEFDETELTKYIIGAFSAYEKPLSNAAKARRSFGAYISHKTYEDAVRERREMLGITKEQFREMAEVFDRLYADDYLCAVGNETKIKENKDMFGELVTIN